MDFTITTPPTVEPVTATELGEWLRGVTGEDATLEMLITAARQFIETQAHLSLAQQTITTTMDRWGSVGNNDCDDFNDGASGWHEGVTPKRMGRYIELPRAPLVSINHVKIYKNGAMVEIASSDYFIDTNSMPGRLILNDGVSWPIPGRSTAGIEIEYIAGYASLNNEAALKVAIMQLAAHFYENREAVTEMTLSNAPKSTTSIIERYKVVNPI